MIRISARVGRSSPQLAGRSRSSSASLSRAADGGQPAPVTFAKPGDQLVRRARACATSWNEGRLVAAQRAGTKGVILVHPFAPAHVLDDVGNRALPTGRERSPIFYAADSAGLQAATFRGRLRKHRGSARPAYRPRCAYWPDLKKYSHHLGCSCTPPPCLEIIHPGWILIMSSKSGFQTTSHK